MTDNRTGNFLVLSRKGQEPERVAGRFADQQDADWLAEELYLAGEQARVVAELSDCIHD